MFRKFFGGVTKWLNANPIIIWEILPAYNGSSQSQATITPTYPLHSSLKPTFFSMVI